MTIAVIPHQYENDRKGEVKIILPICHVAIFENCNAVDSSVSDFERCLERHKRGLGNTQHEAIVWPQNCFPNDLDLNSPANIQNYGDDICIYGCKSTGKIVIKDPNRQIWEQEKNDAALERHIFLDSPLGDFFVLSEDDSTDKTQFESIIDAIWKREKTFSPDFIIICATSHDQSTRQALRSRLRDTAARTLINEKLPQFKPHILVRDRYFASDMQKKDMCHILYEGESGAIPPNYAKYISPFIFLTLNLCATEFKFPAKSTVNSLLTESANA